MSEVKATTAADNAVPAEVKQLDALDDDQFQGLVQANINTAAINRQLWAALCHPALADRTLGCLDELIENLESEVTTRMLQTGHAKVKTLNNLRNRRNQVIAAQHREAARVQHVEKATQDAEHFRTLLRRLTIAVNEHRLTCITENLAPEPHDLALWEMLDELRVPAGDPSVEHDPSLAELVTSGAWYELASVDVANA